MKNIIMLALLAAGTEAAHAQSIAAGTILLGGSIGYSQQSTEGAVGSSGTDKKLNESSQFNVSPTAAYFVAENLALGLNLDFLSSSSTHYRYLINIPIGGGGSPMVVDGGESKVTERSLRVGPVARYYKFIGEKAAFFGQLGAGYQSSRREVTVPVDPVTYGPNELTTGSGFYAQLTPGFAFFPSNKFGLEVTLRGLGYQRLANEVSAVNPSGPNLPSRKSTTSRFESGFGLSGLQLGAAFYLGRE